MRTQTIIKNPWTKGEKFLLGAILLTVALAALGTFWWRRVNANPVVIVPTPTLPAQNAFDYFNAAAALEMDRKKVDFAQKNGVGYKPSQADPWDRCYSPAEKAALVQENAAALNELRRGLAYPYQNPPIRSFNTRVRYFGTFRSLAQLLALDAQVRCSRGDWNSTARSSLDAIQMGGKIPRGLPLGGTQLGAACESLGRRLLWDAVGHLSAAQTQSALCRMEQVNRSHVPLADTLQETKWFTQASLMEVFHHSTWRSEVLGDLSGDSRYPFSASDFVHQQMAQLNLGSKKSVMEDATVVIDELIRSSRQPYTSAVPSLSLAPITSFITDAYPETRMAHTYNEAQDALLLTALALRAYRLEHGSYPATLAALPPAYLKQIPSDPFAASGPLHYKRVDGKYVLYSVGPDGRDDGGKPIFDTTLPAPPPGQEDARYSVWAYSQGDVVAGVND